MWTILLGYGDITTVLQSIDFELKLIVARWFTVILEL